MDYKVVKKQIIDKSLGNFYIFTGDELEVQQRYVHKIAETKGQKIKRIDQVVDAFKTKGFSLLNETFCYVCRDDADFLKAEAGWKNIENLIGSNTLILLITKVDKRKAFYKFFSEQIVSFDQLNEDLLVNYIKKEIDLDKPLCRELIGLCEGDYGKILLELDKLKNFIAYKDGEKGEKVDQNAALEYLIDSGAIHRPPQDAIFDWVDAIMLCKPKTSFRLYEECKLIGEPALRLLLVLYTQIRRILQVQSCPSHEVAKTTGLSQWEINLTKGKQNVYTNKELVQAMKLIKQVETGIKTGTVDESVAVDYVMVNILNM